MTITRTLSLLAAVGMAAVAAPAFATTYTYTGLAANPHDWSVKGNWSPSSGSPATGDVAQFAINATMTANLPASLAEIDVTTTAQVDLNPGSGSMSVGVVDVTTSSSGTLLTIESGFSVTVGTSLSIASGTQLTVVGGLTNSGSVSNLGTVEFSSNRAIDDFSNQTGTIIVNAVCTTSGAFTDAGPMTVDTGASFTPHGALTNNSSVTITVTGVLDIDANLSASMTNSGTITTTSAGMAQFKNGADLNGAGTLANNGTFEVDDGTCDIASTQAITDGTTMARGAWQVNSPNATAKLRFNSTYGSGTALAGNFALYASNANSFIEIAAGQSVTTSGSYHKGGQSNDCAGLVINAGATYVWASGFCN